MGKKRNECEECGQEIAGDAIPCPHCGKPAVINLRDLKTWLIALFAGALMFVLLWHWA